MNDRDRELLIIGGVLFLGVCAVLCWEMSGNEDTKVRMSGFDAADGTKAAPPAPRPVAPATSIGMARIGELEQYAASPESQPPAAAADKPLTLKEAALKSGGAVSAYTKSFRAKHPIMKQYSKEWMSYPDLKKLNDDYMRDKDPKKFLDNLAKSPNFGRMAKKIAADPKTTALAVEFLTGVVKQAPGDLMGAATGLLNDDKTAQKLAGTLMSALGVSPGLISSLTGGAVDLTKVVNSPKTGR